MFSPIWRKSVRIQREKLNRRQRELNIKNGERVLTDSQILALILPKILLYTCLIYNFVVLQDLDILELIYFFLQLHTVEFLSFAGKILPRSAMEKYIQYSKHIKWSEFMSLMLEGLNSAFHWSQVGINSINVKDRKCCYIKVKTRLS